MKTNKRLLRLTLELLCLALAFSMLLCTLPAFATEAEEAADGVNEEAAADKVTVVCVIEDSPLGTRLTKSKLEVKEVPALNVPENAIHSIEEAEGKFLKESCYSGEYINTDQLSKTAIAKVSSNVLLKPIVKSGDPYVVVTDYLKPNTGEDLSTFLQEMIDVNPRRTIYFPDGEYVIARSLFTSADGETSVSLSLADGAVIKAADNWMGKAAEMDEMKGTRNALICLGQAKEMNDIRNIGHYYLVTGGTLDGNNKADGLSVDSGRESVVRNICIKNAVRGIVVEKGANNKSSDCDFEDITIISNPSDTRTVGLEIIGYDNSFTNIRIYNAQIGIEDSVGAGNLMKSIYITRTVYNKYYDTTIGVKGEVNNWYSQFHVTNYAVAYKITTSSMIWDCTAEWTIPQCTTQTVIRTNSMNLPITGIRAYFLDNGGNTSLISGVKAATGQVDRIESPIFDEALCKDKTHNGYLTDGGVIPLS